jgi:hypothetical protein
VTGRRLLPSDAELTRWHQQGLTAPECADIMARRGVEVTPAGIRKAWNRLGLVRRPMHDQDIPWRVKAEHSMQKHIRRLRSVGRVREYCEQHPEHGDLFRRWIEGEPLTEDEVAEFDAIATEALLPFGGVRVPREFAAWWREMRRDGTVVYYTRENGSGLTYARAGIDKGFTFEPIEQNVRKVRAV